MMLSVCGARVWWFVLRIERVYYDQCDEDVFNSIAVLVSATGLHPELVAETHPQDESKAEAKEDNAANASTKPSQLVST
jgi:hypothetical protein